MNDAGLSPPQTSNTSNRSILSAKASSTAARIALFSAVNVVFDSVPGIPQFQTGVWMSWVFITESLTGVFLGPRRGALAVMIGVLLGNFFNPRGPAEFLFMMGAPVGAMVSGYVYRQRFGRAAVYQTALLAAYFLTPAAWGLPIWGMWDTYLAYVLLMWRTVLVSTRARAKRFQDRPVYRLLFSAFVGLESDILFRIFLLIPCQTYSFIYGFDVATLRYIWLGGALVTPLQVALSLFVGTVMAMRLTSVPGLHEVEQEPEVGTQR